MLALFLSVTLPTLTSAQSFPALYDVVAVAEDDVLNLRSEPSLAADVIGSLAHDQTGVEVVALSEDRAWARVNQGDGSGWVSRRFLDRQPFQLGGRAPDAASCYGTEPFWSLDIAPAQATFDTPDGLPLAFKVTQRLRSRNQLDRHMSVYESDIGGMVTTLKATACSDRMSDRVFGWELDLMLYVAGSANAQMFSGCCSIAPTAN